MKVIHYQLKDLPHNLRQTLIKKSPRTGWSKDIFRGCCEEPERAENMDVFIALHKNNDLLGYLTVHDTDIKIRDIGQYTVKEYNIYVLPKYRKKKVGGQLVATGKFHYPDSVTICFPDDERGRNFYKKHELTIFNEKTMWEVNPLSTL